MDLMLGRVWIMICIESPVAAYGHYVVELAVHNTVVVQELYLKICTSPFPL